MFGQSPGFYLNLKKWPKASLEKTSVEQKPTTEPETNLVQTTAGCKLYFGAV